MQKWCNLKVVAFTFVLFLSSSILARDQNLSPEFGAVVLHKNAWKIVAFSQDGEVSAIYDQRCEPGSVSASRSPIMIFYFGCGSLNIIGADDTENQFKNYRERFLGLTDLFWQNGRKRLLAVAISKGGSAETDIVSIDINHPDIEEEFVVYQRGTQFYPFGVGEKLLYASVHCVEYCGSVVQELWLKRTSVESTRQITLSGSNLTNPGFWGNSIVYIDNRLGANPVVKMLEEPYDKEAVELDFDSPVIAMESSTDGRMVAILVKPTGRELVYLSEFGKAKAVGRLDDYDDVRTAFLFR